MRPHLATALLSLVLSCGSMPFIRVDAGATVVEVDAGALDAGSTNDSGVVNAGSASDSGTTVDAGPSPWADRLVRFMPGPGAGFGQNRLPDVVLGPPQGGGIGMGSLDVVSLGQGGVIELEFTDWVPVDGPGPDFAVYENPFGSFSELASVSVSNDGVTWVDFPCSVDDRDGGYPGCTGVRAVLPSTDAGIVTLGGDLFDLATVNVTRARFVRITDTGTNRFYAPPTGGFDLDACGVINGAVP